LSLSQLLAGEEIEAVKATFFKVRSANGRPPNSFGAVGGCRVALLRLSRVSAENIENIG
jgi:hypothetical protein